MCDNLLGEPGRNPWNTDRTPGRLQRRRGQQPSRPASARSHTAQTGQVLSAYPQPFAASFGFKPSFGRPALLAQLGHLVRPLPQRSHLAHCRRRRPLHTGRSRTRSTRSYCHRQPSRGLPRRRGRPASRLARPCVSPGAQTSVTPAVDPDVRRLAGEAAQRFAELGLQRGGRRSQLGQPRAPGAEVCWFVSMAARVGHAYDESPDAFEPQSRRDDPAGPSLHRRRTWPAEVSRTVFYNQSREFFEDYDLLLTPQMPLTAWRVDDWPAEIDGTPTPSIFDRLPFTYPFNLTGQPARERTLRFCFRRPPRGAPDRRSLPRRHARPPGRRRVGADCALGICLARRVIATVCPHAYAIAAGRPFHGGELFKLCHKALFLPF